MIYEFIFTTNQKSHAKPRKAYDLFATLFPNHKVIQNASLDIFSGGGGIHCIAQQQPRTK